MGEAITRHSLRPLRFPRASYLQHSGANASRDRVDVFTPRWYILVSPVEGAAGAAKPGAVGLAAIRRSARIAVGPWPLSQSRPNAVG
jgi:hypothetical protein